MCTKKNIQVLVAFSLFLSQYATAAQVNSLVTAPKTEKTVVKPTAPSAWKMVIEGYEATGSQESAQVQKIFLSIEKNIITGKSSSMPEVSADTIVISEKEAGKLLLFPGLVDMHGHMKYNVLPLWDLATGEFNNRFDWRGWGKYKDAVSFNMKALSASEDVLETNGIQIVKNKKREEGVLSKSGELIKPQDDGQMSGLQNDPHPKDGKVDLSSLNICAAVRYAEIKALVSGTTSMQGIGTDTKCANQFGVKNVEIKGDYDVTSDVRATTDIVPQDYVIPIMTEVLQPHIVNEQKRDAKYSFATAIGLLKNRKLPVKDEVDKKLKRFFDMSMAAWDGYLKFLTEAISAGTGRAAIVHLAEGSRVDAYNQYEYQMAKLMGLTRKGFVVIHGVGMSKEDFQHAAEHEVNLVWSPFSNLLLYGQTLDVVEAYKKQHVNVSIGSDWAPTGSKNLLDELKIARRYLDHQEKEGQLITDKDLVDMATINAAKALRLESKLGKLEKGYLADIMAISLEDGKNPYSSLVNAEQGDVQLVVVNGQALYGDRKIMEKVVTVTKDALELLPRKEDGDCAFEQTKALRLPFKSAYDQQVEADFKGKINLLTYSNISYVLTTSFNGYSGKITSPGEQKKLIHGLDKVYKCQDKHYNDRFSTFIEKELPDDILNHEKNKIDADKGINDLIFKSKADEIRRMSL